MHLAFVFSMLAVRALAAPQLGSSTGLKQSPSDGLLFGNALLQFNCNPPFPKTKWTDINELVLNLGQYQPFDQDGKPISTPTKTSTKRQELEPLEELEDAVDLLSGQNFGKSKTEKYEVKPEECLYIAAVGAAGAWICNDDPKKSQTFPFEKAQNAVLGAARMCLPTKTEYQKLIKDCRKDGKQGAHAETCAKGKIRMSVQASSPPGEYWNVIIRESERKES